MAKKPSKAVSSRQRTFDGRMPKGVWVRNHRLAGAFCMKIKNINWAGNLKIRKFLLVIGILLLLGFTFYWYEIRPSQIKHDCSWIKEYVGGSPSRLAMTEKQLKENGLLKNCSSIQKMQGNGAIVDLFNDKFEDVDTNPKIKCENENKRLISVYSQAKPAVIAKERQRETTNEEYKFCLRDKGL